MTPNETDMRLEDKATLSTADLASAGIRSRSNSPGIEPPRTPEPNLPLFAQNASQDLRSRWEKIQIGFVDEPRNAVEQADQLVASAIKQLAEVFAGERQKLEAGWEKTDDVSTEDLRIALRRYRSFFDRLLSV